MCVCFVPLLYMYTHACTIVLYTVNSHIFYFYNVFSLVNKSTSIFKVIIFGKKMRDIEMSRVCSGLT